MNFLLIFFFIHFLSSDSVQRNVVISRPRWAIVCFQHRSACDLLMATVFFTTFSDVNRFTCRVNTPELPLNKYISKLWYFLSLWYEMEKGSVYSRWTGSVVDCSRRFIDCVLLDHKVHLIIVMKTNMNE